MKFASSLLRVAVLCTLLVAVTETRAAAEEKGNWINISESVVAKLTSENKKPGEHGPASGVAVDRKTGDVYLLINGQGLWKSTDQGQNFQRIDLGTIGGRGETGFAVDVDPAGGKLACFPVYGSAAITTDGGKTWEKSSAEHIDCIAVAWKSMAMLAIRHESGGALIYSPDAGRTWRPLGKGFSGVGLFDEKILIGVKGDGIHRSTDAGQTWSKVSDLKPQGQAMRVFKDAGYIVSEQGILVSRDKGQTWDRLGTEVKATVGPCFGRDEQQILVCTKRGLMETTDGGATWKLAAPLPPGMDGGYMCHLAWDPLNNIIYLSRMTQPAWKLHQ